MLLVCSKSLPLTSVKKKKLQRGITGQIQTAMLPNPASAFSTLFILALACSKHSELSQSRVGYVPSLWVLHLLLFPYWKAAPPSLFLYYCSSGWLLLMSLFQKSLPRLASLKTVTLEGVPMTISISPSITVGSLSWHAFSCTYFLLGSKLTEGR